MSEKAAGKIIEGLREALSYAQIQQALDAARERIAELEADLRRAADHGIAFANSMAEARSQRDAAEARERKLVEALRPFAEYGRLQALLGRPAPRTGAVVAISVREETAEITVEHLARAIAALSPDTPAAPEIPKENDHAG